MNMSKDFIEKFPKETALDGYLYNEVFHVHDVPQKNVNFKERLRRMEFMKRKNKVSCITYAQYNNANNIKKQVPEIYNFIKNNNVDIILNDALSLYLGTRVKHTIVLENVKNSV